MLALGTDDERGDRDERRTLTADGMAARRVQPDLAILRLGVTSRAATAAAATDETSAALDRVIAALRSAGVTALQTEPAARASGAGAETQAHACPADARRFVARQAVTVRTRELDDAGALIDAALEAGTTNVRGPRFTLADAERAQRQLLAEAVRDARAAARRWQMGAGCDVDGRYGLSRARRRRSPARRADADRRGLSRPCGAGRDPDPSDRERDVRGGVEGAAAASVCGATSATGTKYGSASFTRVASPSARRPDADRAPP